MIQDHDYFMNPLPKESLELIKRNMKIRDVLKKIYADYRSNLKPNPKDFETIFNEIFRYFFRPLETAILGTMQMILLLPTRKNMRLFEIYGDTLHAYEELLKSIKDHLELTMKAYEVFFAEPIKNVKDFMVDNELELHEFEIYRLVADYPYTITNRAIMHISKSFDSWERFSEAYFLFKGLMKETYMRAVSDFITAMKDGVFENYSDFANEFYSIAASHFDLLLKSDEYLEVQREMNSSLMDHIFHFRRFAEEVLENNPASPFATLNQIDEAYRRISDLRRKILELERRLETGP
ncbi:poly(R)-hydroxyalkanoic acid synthase subunit PhaE [Archaeoglobus neptunius]|uniref:poly(R)-hydroxyalkanoic acid synthase subunit PhaE n=1 Tax=Archaeoglobus neptunius TaxID=2798580 RepID=UPI0019258DDE|nr:poly(R)-hydroxyalkanoic acid synthase subunit PhaE [Archaeoglobus neptunius]